ncbi:MAG: hypothetical protein OEY29_10825 [Gammaproteobacteria bacterium]|nr:hypothetical protein [Gammaproteobacteria bacterium]
MSEDEFDTQITDDFAAGDENAAEKNRSSKGSHDARRQLDTLREDREMERLMKGCSDVWDTDFY